MKKTKRLWALLLVMVMALGLITTAFAAPTIDSGRKASLSLYKYDITAASADGAWDAASCVSTGVQDDAVTDKLAKYAIQGVEFSYLRVASISTYSQRENGQYKVGVLYGFADDAVLQAIGLGKADAYKRGNGVFYFTSDKLNKALADALADNATTVKNALEIAVRNGGKAMPETDETGHSKVGGLEQGLYLVVETRVPENVTSTCNPFFVSLPMTTIDGKDWNYDVTVYPKNQTGSPDLEKTVREDKNSTGKNTGSLTDIADGYVESSDLKHSFHKNGTDRSLYVFEAPIDLLSHITLYPAGWLEHSYVACCGTSIQPVLERLRQNPKLDTVYLCLDNDEAGEDASDGMLDTLEDMGYDVERLRPEGKDWNDDLRAKRGGHG